MEDPRTRAALDNLADLFLTGTAPVGVGAAAAAASANPPSGNPPAPGAGAGAGGAEKTDRSDALDGPRPIRLAPKLRPNPPSQGSPLTGLPMPPARPSRLSPPGAPYAGAAANKPSGFPNSFEKSAASTSGTAGSIGVSPDDFDDAADDENDDTQGSGPMRGPKRDGLAVSSAVEAVFLGNLPGFGGPWLTQYARFLAQGGPGPVGVLRVDGEQISLELVGTPKPPLPQDLGEEDADSQQTVESWAALAAGEENLIELLDGLASFETTPVRRWLVNFVRPSEPAAVAMARELDRWTFLCGADQAAVVGAYRLLKQLVDADGGQTERQVGFMIMGSDEATSRRIVDRVGAAAAEGLLRRPLEFRGTQKQMMPVSLHIIGSFAQTPKLWEEMVGFFQSQGDIEEAPLGAAEQEDDLAFPSAGKPAAASAMTGDARLGASLDMESIPEEMVSADPPARAMPLAAAPSPARPVAPPAANVAAGVGGSQAAPPPVRPSVAPSVAQPAAPSSENEAAAADEVAPARPRSFLPPRATPPAPRTAQRPAAQVSPAFAAESAAASSQTARASAEVAEPTEAAGVSPDFAPDLAQYVAGGVALEARCPRHPQTSLVLDEQGVLHLLRRHASAPPLGMHRDAPTRDATQEVLRAAIVDLIEARAWVRENLVLLSMTQRQFRFDAAAEPVLHLFTDQAKPAAALVAHLGALIKLHLLHEVRVGATVSWFSTELN
ncbi:MAG: hypothetical protein NTW19_22180 [Planctomycetota bacterium]|nr:hypothetical protein [Planctomycetota bacterium]